MVFLSDVSTRFLDGVDEICHKEGIIFPSNIMVCSGNVSAMIRYLYKKKP